MFLSAGEASGDHYGAQLITALKDALPEAGYTGLGGTEMEQTGQQRTIRAEDVAVMGITEILRHIPHIYRSYRRLVAEIKINKPDVAVLIDFPDVNFRLAKHLHRAGVPVLWFVSPQLWAWKRSRLRWVQQRVSKMFVIFPFEQEFYRNRGVDATFTGHPLADLPLPTVTREEYAERNSLDPAKQWVALLPGSRWKEVRANLPAMVEAAQQYPPNVEFILPIAATLQRSEFAAYLESLRTPQGKTSFTLVHDARAALHHARASVVASGTATVQAALIGNPFLVVYRVSDLTFRVAKRLIRYPAEIPAPKDQYGNLPIAMPNLIAGKRIVPELLQNHSDAIEIKKILNLLLEDSPERAAQIADLASLRKLMKPANNTTAIGQLKDAVLQALGIRS
ncbi:lipid-A-disaccharide synthase [Terriglobus saanensis]|uniref:lipid-A-disaccharide synthase n=1 Tax=Terriglobus saanensis TaxID=870903 RepID=UPI001FE0361B|nr:lipid-A-disaccharide synthase [Terriglobus saanensis]